MTGSEEQGRHETGGSILKCEDIRALLLDYMTRELGDARSRLVREHLRRCPHCQQEASEIGDTLELLRAASQSPLGFAPRLSHGRRKRVRSPSGF